MQKVNNLSILLPSRLCYDWFAMKLNNLNLNQIETRSALTRPESTTPIRPAKLGESKDRVSLSRSSRTNFSSSAGDKLLNRKKWTILFYLDGNNQLSPMELRTFQGLKETGPDENLNLGVLLALKGHPVKRGMIKNQLTSKTEIFPEGRVMAQNPEDYPLSSRQTLERFLQWGARKCPAQHYALVISGVGKGILGLEENPDSGEILKNQELALALSKFTKTAGQKLEVINLDSDLSAGLEIAYQIKEDAGFLVASQELENTLPLPGLQRGMPHHKVVGDLKMGLREKDEISGEELAKLYVFEAEKQLGAKIFTPTQSALDLSKIKPVAKAADRLAETLTTQLTKSPENRYEITKALKHSQKFLALDFYDAPHNNYRDLGDFAKNILKNRELSQIKVVETSARQVLKTLKQAVVAEHHSPQSLAGKNLKGSSGLSTYLPLNYGKTSLPDPLNPGNASQDFNYPDLAFARDTQWPGLLQAISRDELLSGKLSKKETLEQLGDQLKIEMEKVLAPLEEGIESLKKRDFKKLAKTSRRILSSALPQPLNESYKVLFKCLAGTSQAYKGYTKIKQALLDSDYSLKDRLRVTAEGAVDASQGIGSIIACESLLTMGAIIQAPWSTALVLTAITLRIGYEMAGGYYKAYQADRMSVSEKIDFMNQEQQDRKKPHPPA